MSVLPSLAFHSSTVLLLPEFLSRAELTSIIHCLAARSALSPPLPSTSSPRPTYTAPRFRNLFPGFGIAVVAFTAYVVYDETVNAAKKNDHHGAGHH
ncbi:hypothetical protein JCM1840_003925 [Sporobolomyces johnsonii]